MYNLVKKGLQNKNEIKIHFKKNTEFACSCTDSFPYDKAKEQHSLLYYAHCDRFRTYHLFVA